MVGIFDRFCSLHCFFVSVHLMPPMCSVVGDVLSGIVAAMKKVKLDVPLVVRLEGTSGMGIDQE